MTIAQQIGRASANIETATRAKEFANLARFLMLSRGSLGRAAQLAKEARLGPSSRVADILEAATFAGGVSRASLEKAAQNASVLTGSAFADFSIISQGFVSSLANASAFDGMMGSMVPVPLGLGTVGAVSVGASAFSIAEGSIKQMSKLTIMNQHMTAQKAHCLVVITEELARSDIGNAIALISHELRQAVAVTTDTVFLSTLTSGVSVATSSGPTAESVRADISNLLMLVTTGQGSRLFIVTTPLIVKMWSMLTNIEGESAFPELTPTGGNINGIIVIPSDGVTAGQVILVDASGIAAAPGEVVLQQFREATIQMDSSPDSPPTASTTFINLWQSNLVAVIVERFFCAVKLRSDAVAVVSNSNSYQSGNSPP